MEKEDNKECSIEENKSANETTNKRGPYKGYTIKKYIGSISSFDDLETIPKSLLDQPLPQPRIHIKDANITYELVHPERFNISEGTDDQGMPINCLGAALKHVCNIDYNIPTIERNNICEIFDQLSGCHLVELRRFNRSRVRTINKNKRARHNKCVKEKPDHICIQIPTIDYWRIFEVNAGCLLLECSIRDQSPRHHLLVLNFSKNYIYESGNKYQPFEGGGKLEKDQALKILSKFKITDINSVWLIARRTEKEKVPTQSIYGDLTLPENFERFEISI